jgi:hypothetical protein
MTPFCFNIPEDMIQPETINQLIRESKVDTNKVSDGYHTFGELYEHRIVLFIALCRQASIRNIRNSNYNPCWKSLLHSDGTSLEGWFIMGYGRGEGHQITYHMPMEYWDHIKFAEVEARAPKWDGHTSQQALDRIKMYLWEMLPPSVETVQPSY